MNEVWHIKGPHIADENGLLVGSFVSPKDGELMRAAPEMAERLRDIVQAYEARSASALQVFIEDTRALLAKAGL